MTSWWHAKYDFCSVADFRFVPFGKLVLCINQELIDYFALYFLFHTKKGLNLDMNKLISTTTVDET